MEVAPLGRRGIMVYRSPLLFRRRRRSTLHRVVRLKALLCTGRCREFSTWRSHARRTRLLNFAHIALAQTDKQVERIRQIVGGDEGSSRSGRLVIEERKIEHASQVV